MKQICQAVTTLSKKQCKKNALPGSKYCFFHIEKTPLLISLILGTLITLSLSAIWYKLVPSEELKALNIESNERKKTAAEEEKRDKESSEKLLEVSEQLSQVQTQLEPFISLANEKYPNIELAEALNKLNNDIKNIREDLSEKNIIIQDLTVKVKKAEKGISVTYDFSGNKWETVKHGNNKLVYGSEFEIFSKMQTLEQQKKYQELIPICEEQIKKTSEWLTPYLYLGIAYANLGNKEKAIELFEHVQRNALGDPEYSPVNDFLKGLKGN